MCTEGSANKTLCAPQLWRRFHSVGLLAHDPLAATLLVRSLVEKMGLGASCCLRGCARRASLGPAWQFPSCRLDRGATHIRVVPLLFLKSVRVGVVDFVDDFFYESTYKKIACAKFQPLISFLIPAGTFLNPDFDLFLASFKKF